ncbi:sensor histidine kinase [Rhodococcus sp. SJ-3]|uniref:sensor histidine kinase n=1 Tax=Rhodococcus sp. SJ-3 TaxID=3454628 RepID=UPI003F7A10F8
MISRSHWMIVVVPAAAIFLFVVLLHTLTSDTTMPDRSATIFALLQATALVSTAFRPWAGWSLSFAATLGATVVVGDGLWVDAMINSHFVVLAAAGVRISPRSAVAMWCALAAATVALAVMGSAAGEAVETLVLAAVVLVAAGAIRAAVHARRTLAVERDAAEHDRERAAVLSERARIARELHDVVAHHMSVVAIQAQAARYRVTDPPPELTAGLDAIHSSATEALTEMRRILGVLRSGSDEMTPSPRLADLPRLLDGVRDGGVDVRDQVVGDLRELPAGVELSAYRIVQEAVSNAVRHAPGATIDVCLAYGSDGLRLRIHNGPAREPVRVVSGAGQGMIGMRERVAALGGRLETGPEPEGGFVVETVLPIAEGVR